MKTLADLAKAVALLMAAAAFLLLVISLFVPAPPLIDIAPCSTDTDCMERYGGDGEPAGMYGNLRHIA
jgi:hypothetical protein